MTKTQRELILDIQELLSRIVDYTNDDITLERAKDAQDDLQKLARTMTKHT